MLVISQPKAEVLTLCNNKLYTLRLSVQRLQRAKLLSKVNTIVKQISAHFCVSWTQLLKSKPEAILGWLYNSLFPPRRLALEHADRFNALNQCFQSERSLPAMWSYSNYTQFSVEPESHYSQH